MESGSDLVKGQETEFAIDEVMSLGFESFKRKFWKFFGLICLAGFICVLPQLVTVAMKYLVEANLATMAVRLLLGLVSFALSILMALGIINLQIGIVRGRDITSGDLWNRMSTIWCYIGAGFLYFCMLAVGFIFLIIPALFVHIVFQFYPYFVVEHKMGPIQALKASFEITEGSRWELFFLWLILGFIRGLGMMFLYLPYIPADLFGRLAETQAYSLLLAKKPHVVPTKSASEAHGLIE